ncbi:MAG: PHP domain-containing protein [Bradymonadaceae bacterium]
MGDETGIRAEIHTHSTASDGEFEPAEVARMCAEAGVEVWALTDHDNCQGIADAKRAADELGLDFIPGIELSAYEDKSVHVLGYGVDPESEAMTSLGDRMIEAREERMGEIAAKLRDLGVEVHIDQVRDRAGEQGALARPHMARTLRDLGHVETVQEAFDRYIEDGGPAYVPVTWPSIPEAIRLIRKAGGVPVLAHPGRYDLDDRIPEWVEAGIEGIEIAHPSHDQTDERHYRAVAEEHGLFTTRSSDFHGTNHESWEYFGDMFISPDLPGRLTAG